MTDENVQGGEEGREPYTSIREHDEFELGGCFEVVEFVLSRAVGEELVFTAAELSDHAAEGEEGAEDEFSLHDDNSNKVSGAIRERSIVRWVGWEKSGTAYIVAVFHRFLRRRGHVSMAEGGGVGPVRGIEVFVDPASGVDAFGWVGCQ